MNVTGVRVKIYDEGKCIHEHETARSEPGNDLKTLMRNLRDAQSEANNFLTALIERRGETAVRGTASQSNSDVDLESAEEDENEDEDENENEKEKEENEERANPKKCKLST
ncbi:hypothetical protein PUN28_002569 [Cardiocondyla obscurior]|uniref:Uncharacterized protein n=1 Tax=Cardiocondyla obscurior TaxID=286306 RepID=A0AAW2GUW3_9HYME